MKITVSLIDKLIRLTKGESLPSSMLKGEMADKMLSEGVLLVSIRGSRKSYRACDEKSLRDYISANYSIRDLESYRTLLQQENLSRAEQVAVTGDSKTKQQRTFKGFLVNCYEPIKVSINNREITLKPECGTFMFVYDYTTFHIPEDVVIIGVENAENFRYIREQQFLFKSVVPADTPILFVSRYPQNQSHDIMQWLLSISNRYIHFGDLDLAGIHIYLTEYYCHLGNRSSFLIPDDYEDRISKGSAERYKVQYPRFGNMEIEDERVSAVVECIHKYRRGYDQEGFIDIK